MNALRAVVGGPAWALSIVLVLPACSEGTEPPPLAGGGTATGNAGAGGMPSGNGGASAQGGTGGAAGAGGGLSGFDPPQPRYTFASSLDGWFVNRVCPTAVCETIVAPAAPSPGAAADAGGDAGEVTTPFQRTDFFELGLDPAQGDPAPSAKLSVQFSGVAGQLLNFAHNFDPMAPVDLTHKQVQVRVRVDAGGPATTAKIYTKTTTNYAYNDSGGVSVAAGNWTTLTYSHPNAGYTDPANPFDIAQVLELGIEFTAPSPIVVYIDTIQY